MGEVKASITSVAVMTDALEKIRSVKALDRSNGAKTRSPQTPGISLKGVEFNPSKNHRDQIMGFVFTSVSLGKETLLEQIQSYNAQHP